MNLPKRDEMLHVIDTLTTRYLRGKVRAVKLSIIALLDWWAYPARGYPRSR